MLLIIYCLLFMHQISSLQSLDGPNVCTEEREHPILVKKPSKIAYETTKFKWCLKIPPRCKVTDVVYREGYKEELEYVKNLTKVCCPGFAEAKNRCIPICSNPCIHGICIAPDRCECQPNYKGIYCEIECQADDSDGCKQELPCRNGGQLINSTAGLCSCLPGYTGSNCEKKCPSGTYGLNCRNKCNCDADGYDNAECDHVEGCKVSNYASLIRSEEPVQSTANVTIALLLTVMVSILLGLGFLILKYRKKLQILTNELAFVTYVSSKDPNDRFDNPLYSYQGSVVKDEKQLNMINPGFLPNDLNCENNDLEKGFPTKESNVIASLDDGLDALKNAVRNYTPNIYEDVGKTIEPTNIEKEPDYEEIVNNDDFNGKEADYDSPKSLKDEKPNNDDSYEPKP